MTANLSSSVSAVCRSILICWTVMINVTISLSVNFKALALLYSSDDGCQLEEFPARDLLQPRSRICLQEQFWKRSGDLRMPEGRQCAVFSIAASPWRSNTLCSCWDAATQNAVSIVLLRALLVTMATSARDILEEACPNV
jgi:hypothetical protein